MASVIVQSPAAVLVDGVLFGAVADTIRNNPPLTSAIQVALGAWHDALLASHAAALAAAQAQALAALDTAATCQAELADTRALAQRVISQATAALEDGTISEEEKIAILAMCVQEAAKPAKQRQKEAIEREIAQKQQELAALTVE